MAMLTSNAEPEPAGELEPASAERCNSAAPHLW
jgi:hypothetical protein